MNKQIIFSNCERKTEGSDPAGLLSQSVGVSILTNTDTARYTPSEIDKYVRFEAMWDDGDFIFSNPIFIDLIN